MTAPHEWQPSRRAVETLLRISEAGETSAYNPLLLATLARTWLAVQDAPEVQIGGADGLSAFLSVTGKKSLPSMQGQRVRLVAKP